MAIAGVALALGTAASVVGTITSANAQQRMAEEQRQATRRAENARQQQAQLDASRRQRQALREAMLARATAVSTATSQGAGVGSSVLGAGYQATATGLQNNQTTAAALDLGSRVFDANRAYADATAQGQKDIAWGSALQGIGNALAGNAFTLQRVGTYVTQRPQQGQGQQTPNYVG